VVRSHEELAIAFESRQNPIVCVPALVGGRNHERALIDRLKESDHGFKRDNDSYVDGEGDQDSFCVAHFGTPSVLDDFENQNEIVHRFPAGAGGAVHTSHEPLEYGSSPS